MATDYRYWKKKLNPYFKFSFKMPRKGQDFNKGQKAAITKARNKYDYLINQVEEDLSSFVPFSKSAPKKILRDTNGVVTNKGIFYKFPNAKVKIDKRGTATVESVFGKREEIYIPFPGHVVKSLDAITDYVSALEFEYQPDYIMWSVNGYMGKTRYDPSIFQLYAAGKAESDARYADSPYYDGVFLGWGPEEPEIVDVSKNKRK